MVNSKHIYLKVIEVNAVLSNPERLVSFVYSVNQPTYVTIRIKNVGKLEIRNLKDSKIIFL